ncbi:MAG TPA: radical SAM protein [Geobacteraceae bacterium]|nr:radical SAM protein [Geobacteraceae bacterium]
MRILLTYKAHGAGAADPYTSLLPIGLGYINALLRDRGFDSRIANLSKMGWKETESLLKRERPAILGVSQLTHNRIESLRLADLAKKLDPSCLTVFGGPHATHRAQEILAGNRSVDAIVMGEGEATFLELARSLSEKNMPLNTIRGLALRKGDEVIFTPPREAIADLDTLPFPARFYDNALATEPHRQLEFIITSRGCPAACRFCSSPRFWGRGLRLRSPRSIVDEIGFIRDRYGLIYFSIRDDTFTADRERAMAFCRLLLQEKTYILWNCQSRVNAVDAELLVMMKRAGCECVQFGVESGSRRILRELGKDFTPEQVKSAAAAVRKAGINLSVYLITGVPGETEEDLKATLRLIEEIKPNDGQVSPLAYYPGTPLFASGVKNGTIRPDLFETGRASGFYLRDDPFVARATRALLARLQSVAGKNRVGPGQFRSQKMAIGYCHGTNILAGDYYINIGRFGLAETEYREIVEREPANPWGWLALGELYAGMEKSGKARAAFAELLRLVPAHAPAYAHLGDLCRRTADYDEAERLYREALRLNPADETALEGMAAMHGVK